MEASVTLKKVGKLVGDKTILAGLTFGLEKGSLVAVIGDNDSGKSTLMRLLAGCENPEYGTVYVHGLDILKRRDETCRLVGFVPHEPDFDPWLTIAQNIRFIGLLYKLPEHVIQRRLTRYAQVLELTGFLDQPAGDISLGTQKKALIVRALIHDPQVLVLDEPTAFMDASSRRQVWELLLGFNQQKTIIYASQALQEVERANDRILVLHEGRMVLDGSLEKLLESTRRYHQFRIEFEKLSDDLYKKLSAVTTVVNPSRLGDTFHFSGRSRRTFFHVLQEAAGAVLADFAVKTIGLEDLMDPRYGRGGVE